MAPLVPTPFLSNGRNRLLTAGVGVLALAVTAALAPKRLLEAYLAAYTFWAGLAVGALGLLLLHHLVGGGWGFLIRRILEAAAATLPLMALLFLPVLIFLPDLYPWADPQHVGHDPVLAHKAAYLNPSFFRMRAAVYLLAWCGLAWLSVRISARQDGERNGGALERLKALGAVGLLVYVLTVTFASFDWTMSLEPHWFSSIYGALLMVGHVLAALALATVVAAGLRDHPDLAPVADSQRFHDLGNLLFAFVLLWTYMALSQYLIIWSANLQEEVPWYLARSAGVWKALLWTVLLFQFAAPFLLLLLRANKQRPERLRKIAFMILAAHAVETAWLVFPAFHSDRHGLSLVDPVAFAAMGCVWLALFGWRASRHPLLPRGDVRLAELAPEH